MELPLKVVFIENDPALYEVVEMALTRMGGFAVSGFTDTDGALDSVCETPPDAIFIDAAHVDGKTAVFLKALRAEAGCRHVPVVLASDRKRIHQIRRYKALGATRVIPTPINPFSLAQTIREVLATTPGADGIARASLRPRSGIIEHVGLAR